MLLLPYLDGILTCHRWYNHKYQRGFICYTDGFWHISEGMNIPDTFVRPYIHKMLHISGVNLTYTRFLVLHLTEVIHTHDRLYTTQML